jgi:hypothetical protein
MRFPDYEELVYFMALSSLFEFASRRMPESSGDGNQARKAEAIEELNPHCRD